MRKHGVRPLVVLLCLLALAPALAVAAGPVEVPAGMERGVAARNWALLLWGLASGQLNLSATWALDSTSFLAGPSAAPAAQRSAPASWTPRPPARSATPA